MPYAKYMPSIAPPWMAQTWGERFWRAVGVNLDAVAVADLAATKARMPSEGPADALVYMGDDRRLPRASGETEDDYRARLLGAFEAWGGDNTPITGVGGGAGSHLGILQQLRVLGLPIGPNGITLVSQVGIYSQLDVGGALVRGSLMDCVNRTDLTGAVNPRRGWTFDGRDNFFSLLGLVIPQDVPSFVDGSMLAGEVDRVMRDWKPAAAQFIGTWLIVTGVTLGWPTGRTLATDPVLGGNVVRYVAPSGGNRIGYYSI